MRFIFPSGFYHGKWRDSFQVQARACFGGGFTRRHLLRGLGEACCVVSFFLTFFLIEIRRNRLCVLNISSAKRLGLLFKRSNGFPAQHLKHFDDIVRIIGVIRSLESSVAVAVKQLTLINNTKVACLPLNSVVLKLSTIHHRQLKIVLQTEISGDVIL